MMLDQLYWTIKLLVIVVKILILDIKALRLDVYALLRGWSSEAFLSEDLVRLLNDIVDYFYYVIKGVIIITPAVILLSAVLVATEKLLDRSTPEEEQFLFMGIIAFAGILFLAI